MKLQSRFPLRSLSLLFIGLLLLGCGDTSEEVPTNEGTTEPTTYQLTGNERFEKVPADRTGISFANRITEDHQLNIITNSYMYNGGGVAVLDFNNDQLPDLYFIGSQESNRLYLNKGDFQFEDVTDQAGVAANGGFKTGVTAVDINTDGWMDLYVCRTGLTEGPERANLLFINQQNGTFTEQAASYGLDFPGPSNHANFLDYDLDGDLDMYLLNHPVDFKSVNQMNLKEVDGKRVRVSEPKAPFESDRFFRNNGNNTFTDVSEQAGIRNRAFGLSATVTDINQDGYPDIFVGNDYIEPDILYINQGNGTFSDQTEEYFRHTSNHTMGVDIADFNNDLLPDVVALDMIAEDNRRQKLLMTTMVLQRYKSLSENGYQHQLMRNVLQMNTGMGDFAEIGTLAGISNTDWSWSALLADLDNDGWKDLHITNGYRRDVSNLDYLTYTVDSLNRTGGINQTRFPDFNDFLNLIPSERLQNYVFRNRGDMTFEKMNETWGFAEPSFSNGAAYADLDNDGDLDIIVNNIEDPAFLYRNKTSDQNEGNYLQIELKGAAGNPVAVGSVVEILANGNGQVQELQPVRGFFSSVEPLLHFGLGTATEVAEIKVRWPDGRYSRVTGVAANQKITIDHQESTTSDPWVTENPTPLFTATNLINFQHRENAFEDFNRERLLPHRLSRLGPFLAEGDVDGNGQLDLFVGNASGAEAALFLQFDGNFRKQAGPWEIRQAQYEDMGALFFDADGDEDLDLYVVSGGSQHGANSPLYQDRLFLNDGSGEFQYAEGNVPPINTSGSCVQANDFDGDGDLDLFVGGRVTPGSYPSVPESYILQNEGGKFTNVTAQIAPEFQQIGMVTDIRFGDLDGDGINEMVVAGEWMPITIFKWIDGGYKPLIENGLGNTQGWWNCLALADLDADGDLDIAAGNLGLNSRIRATPAEPLRIYATDFDRNGAIDPIITYINDGVEYPLARRMDMINQMAVVKKKYVYFEDYSTASVHEVLDPDQLASAMQLKANRMETSIFLNDGGSFRTQSLPLFSQIAPTNQIVPADVNADGITDLILAGNNFSADVESGRYDAGSGLVLLGKGDGEFSVVTPAESGLHAKGDVRDLALIPLANGQSVLVATTNNGQLQVWKMAEYLEN
jgi:hypothetical protein